MSKRFERIARSSGYDHRGIMRAHSLNPDTDPALVTDAHSEAIEGLEGAGKVHSYAMARFEERVAALEQSVDDHYAYHVAHINAELRPPTPEPVVVEGEVHCGASYLKIGEGDIISIAFPDFVRVKDGDRVRLTIERVEE